jgi:hypothetical protein
VKKTPLFVVAFAFPCCRPRRRVWALLLVAMLTAGPAQAMNLELLMRMPLETLLQLQFSPLTVTPDGGLQPPRDRHVH